MQFEVFTGGRHTGLMELWEQLAYEEVKAKMVFLDSKVAERIIGIIEKECCFAGEKIEVLEKAISAILAGADLSKIETIEEIERASLEVKFRLPDKTSGDLLYTFTKEDNKSGLEKYSTSQLKAELRRRKGKKYEKKNL